MLGEGRITVKEQGPSFPSNRHAQSEDQILQPWKDPTCPKTYIRPICPLEVRDCVYDNETSAHLQGVSPF